MMQVETRKQVWDTLSSTDYSNHVMTDEDGIQIIQVMSAHTLMMSAYPEYTYEYLQDAAGRDLHYLEDGTAEVRMIMTVAGNAKTVSLPIHRNTQAIKNPSSWDLNTAKQRLRVRAMGEFGLAHVLWIKDQPAPEPVYLGEDTPTVAASDTSMAEDYWLEADLDSCANLRALERRHNRYLNALRTSKIEADPFAEAYESLKAIKCELWESAA
jgi:hypothetical protein|tara:strand:+ start:3234 stop:3869 length:636 start_codon:yes stop_codon:yes gene_type:complete